MPPPPPPRFTFDVMSIAGGPRTLADIGCCFLCLYFESMTVGLARSGYFRSKALFLSCADVCGFLLRLKSKWCAACCERAEVAPPLLYFAFAFVGIIIDPYDL